MKPRYYKLNDSQHMLTIQHQFSLHSRIMQLCVAFTVEEEIDYDLLHKALNVEIERNDSLRLRFKKIKGEWHQYFIDEYKIEHIDFVDFSGKRKEYQNKYLKKKALENEKFMKGDTMRFLFFKSYDGKNGVFVNVCHLIMDGVAMANFMRDWFEVYQALKNGTEMPKPLYEYEKVLQSDEKRAANVEKKERAVAYLKEFFAKNGEPIYAGVQGREWFDKRRKNNPKKRFEKVFDPFREKSNYLCYKESSELLAKITALAEQNKTTPVAIVETAYRTHLSKVNDYEKDVFTKALYSDRAGKEMCAGGCKMELIPVRTVVEEDTSFIDVAKEISQIHMSMYRLGTDRATWADVLADMYDLKLTFSYYPMILNWMVMPSLYETEFNVDFEWISAGLLPYELYAFILPDLSTGGLSFNYEYQVHRMTEKNLRDMHVNMVEYINRAYENPQITVGELMRG